MTDTNHNQLVIICIAAFGLMAFVAIILLSLYSKVVPSEITGLPSVALGGLLGIAFGAKAIVKADPPA